MTETTIASLVETKKAQLATREANAAAFRQWASGQPLNASAKAKNAVAEMRARQPSRTRVAYGRDIS